MQGVQLAINFTVQDDFLQKQHPIQKKHYNYGNSIFNLINGKIITDQITLNNITLNKQE